MGFYLDDEIVGKMKAIQRLHVVGLTPDEIFLELNPHGVTQVSMALILKVIDPHGERERAITEAQNTDKQLLNEGK